MKGRADDRTFTDGRQALQQQLAPLGRRFIEGSIIADEPSLGGRRVGLYLGVPRVVEFASKHLLLFTEHHRSRVALPDVTLKSWAREMAGYPGKWCRIGRAGEQSWPLLGPRWHQ